jgi:hypothetical protein
MVLLNPIFELLPLQREKTNHPREGTCTYLCLLTLFFHVSRYEVALLLIDANFH